MSSRRYILQSTQVDKRSVYLSRLLWVTGFLPYISTTLRRIPDKSADRGECGVMMILFGGEVFC